MSAGFPWWHFRGRPKEDIGHATQSFPREFVPETGGSAPAPGGKLLFCISSRASKQPLRVIFGSGPQLHPLLDPNHLISRRPRLVAPGSFSRRTLKSHRASPSVTRMGTKRGLQPGGSNWGSPKESELLEGAAKGHSYP